MRGGVIESKKIRLVHKYEDIVSLNNLCLAWQEFVRGKRKQKDAQVFAYNLMDNIISLHEDLANKTYQHGGYRERHIWDPKSRLIHIAPVRDHLLHHAIYRILYPFFDRTFIADSFSCRNNKGTHRGINRFRAMAYQVSRNHTRTCWALKCDIRKFFASVDHKCLLEILRAYIPDKDIMWLLQQVVQSFGTKGKQNVGLPLGNLTSQLFANVYMNRFDQFVKHQLKAKYYIRYADDFVILSEDKCWLKNQISQIGRFLQERLRLSLHPDKVFIKTFASGIDYLGWVHFSDHRVLRNATKRRIMRRLQEHTVEKTLQSYLGLLQHGNTFKMRGEVLQSYWLCEEGE